MIPVNQNTFCVNSNSASRVRVCPLLAPSHSAGCVYFCVAFWCQKCFCNTPWKFIQICLHYYSAALTSLPSPWATKALNPIAQWSSCLQTTPTPSWTLISLLVPNWFFFWLFSYTWEAGNIPLLRCVLSCFLILFVSILAWKALCVIACQCTFKWALVCFRAIGQRYAWLKRFLLTNVTLIPTQKICLNQIT